MAIAYPDVSAVETLQDFGYHDFGFMDNTNYDQVLSLPQTSFYSGPNTHCGSFETHLNVGSSLHSPLRSSSTNQYQSLNLQDSSQIGVCLSDDVSTWLQTRVPEQQSNGVNSFQFTPLGSNLNNSTSSDWEFDKPQTPCRDSSYSNPPNFNMSSWNPQIDKLSLAGSASSQRNPISPTGSVVLSTSDFTSFQLQDDMKSGATSHSDNSLSAAESDIQKGEHRRCQSLVSNLDHVQESDIQRDHRRNKSFQSSLSHVQELSTCLPTTRHNWIKQEEEVEPKDVSSMLMDLESKLVASLRKSSPQPVPLNQLRDSGRHIHTGSWEESLTSESTMVSSSPDPSRRAMDLQSMSQFRETTSSPPIAGTVVRSDYANEQERGVRLVNLLIGCADSVANKNEGHAKSLLNELSQMVSPYGDSMQRVASYFTYGLVAHIACTGSGSNLYRALGIKEPEAADALEAFQVFSRICPFMKFGEVSAAYAILEAFQGEQDVQMIDLGMVQGCHWLAYQVLQGLATRPGGPPSMIHLTGIQVKLSPRSPDSTLPNDDPSGRQLKEFAESLNLNFIFQPVSIDRLEHLQPWMLTSRSGQAVAVNCSARMHTLLYDDGNRLNHVLGVIHNLRPRVFTFLEQEASHNGPVFLARFLEALHFYSAMFDSLDASLTRVSPERAKVEQLWLGQEIINIVACDGQERMVRHERSQQWRSRMMKGGFRPVPLSEAAVLQVKSLRSFAYGTGFTILDDRGSLILNWQDRPLFSCSIWTC